MAARARLLKLPRRQAEAESLRLIGEKLGLNRLRKAETTSPRSQEPKAEPKSEKKPGPQVRRATPILIDLYGPTGIPPVKLQVAYAEVNRVITDRNKSLPEARKERPIERDSVRRAILFLKERNTP